MVHLQFYGKVSNELLNTFVSEFPHQECDCLIVIATVPVSEASDFETPKDGCWLRLCTDLVAELRSRFESVNVGDELTLPDWLVLWGRSVRIVVKFLLSHSKVWNSIL